MSQTTNRLALSTSPYLLQHAHNPVDWYPWGQEAFQKAADENKLVLVSIGYSACHWCHVMEREVFENESAAEFMNAHFVCIKVDREERPDVDHTYMDAVQLMGQRGGWPLNVFTLPDGRPIYGGTYFPIQQWMSILGNLTDLKKNENEKILEYAKAVEDGLFHIDLIPRVDNFEKDSEKFETLIDEWKQYLDMEKGGARRAPKFPMPSHLFLLMQYAKRTDSIYFNDYVKITLNKMALGGIYDQIEGGFARYSVDDIWKVPHFEKMLYDNGQLIELYANAARHFNSKFYLRIAKQSADFILKNWKNESGLVFSAADADSEGVEGKYYVWSLPELHDVLEDDFEVASKIYNFSHEAEWEENLILLRNFDDKETAKHLSISETELAEIINRINIRLVNFRSKRIAPGIDTKVITSWNAMFISGLVSLFKSTNELTYLDEAEKLVQGLLAHNKIEAQLYRCKDDKQSTLAFLEDYAFLSKALFELYEATSNEQYISECVRLIENALVIFGDPKGNLLWFSQRDPLTISRKKEVIDNVVPSSNAVFAETLYKVSKIFGNQQWEDRVIGMIAEVNPQMNHASSYTYWLRLQDFVMHSFKEVVLTGSEAKAWWIDLNKGYHPSQISIYSTTESSLPIFEDRFLNKTTAYVCEGKSCSLPIDSMKKLWESI
ncbi:MAG: thioredoxin domain-containing protein [Flavobacteriales bacterium]